jgi:hypothetical protein
MKINLSGGSFNIASFFEKKQLKAVMDTTKEWQQKSPPILIRNIKTTIQSGNSPVKESGRFVEYSPSYKKAILRGVYPGKRLRPVNLTLTGRMMNSLIARNTNTGFTLYFTNKLAKIHSQIGAGKSRTIRKVMPGRGESFKKSITLESDEMVRKILLKNLEI